MLVLTRLLNQKIVIDTGRERIEVVLVQITPGSNGGDARVRLGVTAPVHVQISRDELLVDGPALNKRKDSPWSDNQTMEE